MWNLTQDELSVKEVHSGQHRLCRYTQDELTAGSAQPLYNLSI
jgi:hypothetical protein